MRKSSKRSLSSLSLNWGVQLDNENLLSLSTLGGTGGTGGTGTGNGGDPPPPPPPPPGDDNDITPYTGG